MKQVFSRIALLALMLFTGMSSVYAGSIPVSVMMTPAIVAASSSSRRHFQQQQQSLLKCLQDKGGTACYEQSCDNYNYCAYQICMKYHGGSKACSVKANPNYIDYMHCVNNRGGKTCEYRLNPYYEDFKYCLRGNGGKACYNMLK